MKTSAGKLERLVRAFRGRRMGVLGDFMLDRYVWGSATRLSPEAAVPVVDFVSESQVLGGAGNVAANLAALGAKVEAFGVAGADESGETLRRCLDELGIGSKGLLEDASRMTTVKTRVIARHQQVVRVDREKRGPLDSKLEEKLIRSVKAALPHLDALVISDYDKGVVTDAVAERVLGEAQRRGVAALVKPKTSRLFAYHGATAIVCNSKEAGFFVTRSLADDDAVEQAGRALLAHFGCAAVLITRGEHGLSVVEDGVPRPLHVPATSFEITYARVGLPGVERGSGARQVFDVTGAGDTVLSVLALGVASGASVTDAARLANLAAGVVVGKLGTATLSPAELAATLRELA
ncbi:MAG: bifunctional heptose 7-phosphate kinase/heptose 1-phosphate adenyltransferase [Candidatus Acidiferrales bacterium]